MSCDNIADEIALFINPSTIISSTANCYTLNEGRMMTMEDELEIAGKIPYVCKIITLIQPHSAQQFQFGGG